MSEPRRRWPWNTVDGFEVESLANGHILVRPRYRRAPLEEGCSPEGVFTRMALALFVRRRLMKARRTP